MNSSSHRNQSIGSPTVFFIQQGIRWFSLTLLALLITPLSGFAATEPVSIDYEEEARHQWDAFLRDMNDRRVTGKVSRALNAQSGFLRDDRDPVDVILRRTETLLEDINRMGPTRDLSAAAAKLDALKARNQTVNPEMEKRTILVPEQGKDKPPKEVTINAPKNEEERFAIFEEAFQLQREIAFANPLLADMDRILFIKRHPAGLSHMVDQFFGAVQIPGGGLFVLEDPFGDSPVVRDLLAGQTVHNGRLQGQSLDPGSFLSPEVTYDGQTIYFSYVEIQEPAQTDPEERPNMDEIYQWTPQNTFNIFKCDADGGNLQMLTDGPWDDMDPCELPNGRIAFISTRRGGEGRCHPRPCPTYVLHSMLPDGEDIVQLSYHETNEWHPVVNQFGEILYSRWDYVDRVAAIGQYPWVTKPDGRDARAVHGNYDEGKLSQVLMDPRPIPGTTKFVGTLTQHHNQAYGGLSISDPSVPELVDEKETIKYLTADVATGHKGYNYATAYPLSENYYLAAYTPKGRPLYQALKDLTKYEDIEVPYGVYLIDAFGNKQLLYRDTAISALSPIPLRAREKDPVIPHQTLVGFPPGQAPVEPNIVPDTSEVSILDVYQSLLPWPEDRNISALRIVQLYPKTTPWQDRPNIGLSSMMNARRSLGTVPVEKDGSARFIMPARVPVYFQALDEEGLAIQNMKTNIYTHPGERLSCVGCHERPGTTIPPESQFPIAFQREPSQIEPDASNAEPFIFARQVQPILDAHCVECHEKEAKAPSLKGDKDGWWSVAFKNLEPHVWYDDGRGGRNNEHASEARSVPGEVGAAVSDLYKMLTTGSHKDKVNLSPEEMERITLWIDLNGPFYGAYHDTGDQMAGQLVLPDLE